MNYIAAKIKQSKEQKKMHDKALFQVILSQTIYTWPITAIE